MTAEEEAKFARSQGFIVCDWRLPRKGDRYINSVGKIATAIHNHTSKPKTIVRPTWAQENAQQPLVTSFKAGDYVRVPENHELPVGLGGIWKIISCRTNDRYELVSANGAALVWLYGKRLVPAFKLNDIVNVESEDWPEWNGLARVVMIPEHLCSIHVEPLRGQWRGIVGSFDPDSLKLVAGSWPEDGPHDYDEEDPESPIDPKAKKFLFSDTHESVQWYDELHDIVVNPSDTKATNPKDAIGSSKLPLHLWPETATLYGCLGLLDGALKYGRGNWREAGVRMSIYIDATRRHLAALFEGEDVDPDSGVPHLSHALACLAIIADAQAAGKLIDDRQYPGGYRGLVDELTPHVGRLKAKHEGRDPKHWTIADSLERASGSE